MYDPDLNFLESIDKLDENPRDRSPLTKPCNKSLNITKYEKIKRSKEF